MGKFITGLAIGLIIGALVKPVGNWISEQYTKIKNKW